VNLTHVTFDKVALTVMLSATLVYLGQLIVPVLILIAAMSLDYATGMLAAKYRAEKIDSEKSIAGIKKKVAHLALIAAGILIDVLLYYCINYFDFGISMKFLVAIAILVWLIVNELISILENLKDSGAHIPAWLLPLVKNLKSKAENIAPHNKEENEG